MNNPRHSRLHLIFGDEGMEKLTNATVMVLGLGGVGSACAEALARGGVGNLIVMDGDVVEESNINRQAVAYGRTIGMKKSVVMEKIIEEITPDCTVHARDVFITKDNLHETFASVPRPDYVLDCLDTVTTKLAIAHWCAEHNIHLISSMGAANKMDPSYLRFAQIRRTGNCPLSKVIRLESQKQGIRGIEVLYSQEEPFRINHGGSRVKGETLGSMSYMPPIMGKMIAGKAIRRLTGFEEYPNAPRLSAAAKERLAQERGETPPNPEA